MIELARHIEILLLDNDCVIVPGLGGFMAYHVEARFDRTDNTFLPPLRALGFNPQLTSLNDSLLAQSYVEAYDISYPEAIRKIEAEVTEVRQHISNEGQFELNDIGLLYINKEGNMEFRPCEAGILSPQLYGLSSFEMPPLAEISEQEKKPASQLSPLPQSVETIQGIDFITAPAQEETEEKTEGGQMSAIKAVAQGKDDDTIRIKVAWIRNAVAAAAAVIAFFIMTVPVKNSRNDLQMSQSPNELMLNLMTTSQVKATDKDDSRLTTTDKAIISVMEQHNTQTAPEMVQDPVNKETKKDSTLLASQTVVKTKAEDLPKEKSYYIVLASRVTKKNAEIFVNQLKDKGIDSLKVYEHNNVVRVVYGGYETERDAQNTLRKLRDNDIFEQAWVYKGGA